MSKNLLENVSGTLKIAFNKNALKNISMEWDKWENEDLVPLTEEDLNTIVTTKTNMVICGYKTNILLGFDSENKTGFTLKELLEAVEYTEKVSRPWTSWYDGVDCHHIYFEGLVEDKNAPGVYNLRFGS